VYSKVKKLILPPSLLAEKRHTHNIFSTMMAAQPRDEGNYLLIILL
jgi:hypothetical protein